MTVRWSLNLLFRTALKKLLGDIESGRVARQRLKYLEANYHHLDDAFTALLPIRDGDHTQILLAGYPLPDRGISDDTVCGRDVVTAQRADNSMDGLDYFLGKSSMRMESWRKRMLWRMCMMPGASSISSELTG